MSETVVTHFGNKLRTRICGILIHENKLLMLKHKSINPSGYFYCPPGGGLEFGETMKDCLKREFLEETGLTVTVDNFLFINEFLKTPLHAIEFFFEVKSTNLTFNLGIDPELGSNNQIIQQLEFLTLDEIKKLPSDTYHSFFNDIESFEDLKHKKSNFL